MKTHPFHSLFDDPAAWQVFASGQAEGRLSKITDADGKPGLRLDYDFHGGGGFVAMRRMLLFKLPETFEIGFHMRGEGLPNHFEFKVADPGGTNVWRHLHQDFGSRMSGRTIGFMNATCPSRGDRLAAERHPRSKRSSS